MTRNGEGSAVISRVLILGASGVGKSTVAAQVADQLSVPHVDLDSWRKVESVRVPRSQLVKQAADLAEQDSWCAEGIFLTWTGPLIEAADLVIWLDVPLHRAAFRVLQRWWADRRQDGQGHDIRSTLRLAWSVLCPHDLAAVSASSKNLNPSRAAIAEAIQAHGREATVLRTDRDVELLIDRLRI